MRVSKTINKPLPSRTTVPRSLDIPSQIPKPAIFWILSYLLSVALLAVPVTWGQSAPVDDLAQAEQRFHQALEQGDYELATREAIRAIRPDWHGAVFVHQANRLLQQARIILDATEPTPEQLEEAQQMLVRAEQLLQELERRVKQYLDAGWEATLPEQLKPIAEPAQQELHGLADMLNQRQRTGLALATLIMREEIADEEVARLSPELQYLTALHLADRGSFDRAMVVMQPLQVEGPPAIRKAAEVTSEILRDWFAEAEDRRKWDRLVLRGLDSCDGLHTAYAEQPELAGSLLALVGRLSREHADVSTGRINEVLEAITQLPPSPAGTDASTELLQAKLKQEIFLLQRRMEHWEAAVPSAAWIDRYVTAHCWVYATEANLIAASASPEASEQQRYEQQAHQAAARVSQVNTSLGAALEQRLARWQTLQQPFEVWRERAERDRSYQDQRGTVLPDVLIESRADLVQRVRSGYEARIAELVAASRIEEAWRCAQQAKALSVGRIIAPVSLTQLQSSKLMSLGTGGQLQISRQELFVEYFFGPNRAWAFYLLAPGDQFSPLQVVELPRAEIEQRLATGKVSAELKLGDWFLGGKPTLEQLWSQLEPLKQSNKRLRRVVVAVDGPMNLLSWSKTDSGFDGQVRILPNAAVLGDSAALEGRDVELLWKWCCKDAAAKVREVRSVAAGRVEVRLQDGGVVALLLQDSAE
ncbi:MAG: hypothetical protein HJJLKODD_00867 [Phycisphaerae bacterium]|nr:hypothetical protein [Phycisphaerae bacterium]